MARAVWPIVIKLAFNGENQATFTPKTSDNSWTKLESPIITVAAKSGNIHQVTLIATVSGQPAGNVSTSTVDD